MNVTLEGTKEDCEFDWELSSDFSENSSFKKLAILAKPKCSLQESAQMYTVNFNDISLVVDSSNNTLSTSTLKARSKRYVYISEGEKAALESTGTMFDSSGVATFVLMLGISLFQSVAVGSFWAFVNMLQMIAYLPIINCVIPYNLEMFLTEYLTVKKVVFPFQLLPDFKYNPLRYFGAFLTKPFNDKFLITGYDSLSFIFNFSDEILTWVLLAFFYLLLRILDRLIPRSVYLFLYNKHRCSYIHKWREEYEYNAVIRILIECYLNMNFCALLNIWQVVWYSIAEQIGTSDISGKISVAAAAFAFVFSFISLLQLVSFMWIPTKVTLLDRKVQERIKVQRIQGYIWNNNRRSQD
eukprot:TRINITY_DN817_c0_g1_i8.p5 TRINITY_DN817_c0_g1~~TRINITY_DN817_c0_g1_i8.p5  ORF type:complete len:354 (-),score=14.54 TRINITY_DN817_c0_g1_i8:678-1739(-)